MENESNRREESPVTAGDTRVEQHQRGTRLYQRILDDGSARIADLAQEFSVSLPTIRKDIEELEREGLVERSRGMVHLKTASYMIDGTGLTHLQVTAKKEAVGRKAASLIENGDAVILDCGATATEMAKNLVSRQNLRVVTNALNIAMILGAEPTNAVMMTGGVFKPETLAVSGEKASAFFEGIYANKLFLAVGGISIEVGISYPDFIDLHVKKAMISAAERVYLLADSGKFGVRQFATFGAMDKVHAVVTDKKLDQKYVKWLQGLNIEIIYV
ncbi:MAG: DeoR/GlpR family DNA-binding transcription regulator [Methylobacteriaceae bacterium]|jgi:DeoR/GlpR family transcriptional regulator of sugar metabolism|nr:DeoR/GlpR family DNA-binding transcription regulator [Methylobacteriaceae bacterium]